MAEKKIVTLGIRIDESMLMKIKGLAEVDGVTDSEFARMAISNLVEEREALYTRLHSIFGLERGVGNAKRVEHRSTTSDQSAKSDEE